MLNKYFILIPVIVFLNGCCIGADNTTTSNNQESTNKCKEKQNKINSILGKQARLKKLQLFLEGLNDSNNFNNNGNVKLINDVNEANKLLNDITHNKYNEKELKIIINKFNNKIKQIEKLYKDLFEFSDQDDSNNKNKIKLNKNPKLPKSSNNNVQSMTSLNWSKDTRNNSNVITNPLAVSEDDLNSINGEDNSNPECIIVDLSNPITIQQVQEYYNCSSINNGLKEELPVQGTITNKSHDDEIGTKKINKLPN